MKSSVSLIPLSALYSAVMRTRLAAYQRGWLPVSKLPTVVISVGNLTTGGTGKTPLVEWVCRAISEQGTQSGQRERTKICVLTRGYRRDNPRSQVVVSDGAKLLSSEREAGDEPFLLAKNLLGIAAVISNPDRVAAGQWTVEQLKTEVCVLDDGFQHQRLSRDLDVVVIDATNPWGGGRLLPHGRLREPLTSLSRADCIVITRIEQVEDLASIRETIRRLSAGVPVFVSRMVTSGVRSLNGEGVNSEAVRSETVAAFCGVGNPESFFKHLRHEGYRLALTTKFADHHIYKQSEVDTLVEAAKARGATSLITTAKDAMKLASLNLQLPCFVLEIKISVDDQDSFLQLIRDTILKTAFQ